MDGRYDHERVRRHHRSATRGRRLRSTPTRWNGRGVSDRVECIRQAVEAMHKCRATYQCSFPVTEMFETTKVWGGFVDSFALSGHPQAKRCYAWSYVDDDQPQYVAVLELPPVNSAKSAVTAAIASGQQK